MSNAIRVALVIVAVLAIVAAIAGLVTEIVGALVVLFLIGLSVMLP